LVAVDVSGSGARARERPPLRFAPIQQLRAHEYVAEQVQRHIALRLIGPGESLPSERELAATFGVGRPTVQHALRLLEADRLVETRRGRNGGTFVAAPTSDSSALDDLMGRVLRQRPELEEVLTYRRVLEPRVAREAARIRRREDLAAMSKAIDAMSRVSSEPDYMRHDTEFHLSIAQATRNRFLICSIEDVRLRLNDAMSLLPESDTWHRRLSGEHEAILGAIRSREAEAAEQAMDLHVAASELSVRALLSAISRRLQS
jgi:DNA-binding FadR family transcriptional regulator